MRRLIVPALAAILVADCGANNKADSSAQVQSEIPKVVVTSPSSLPSVAPTTDSKPIDANPCKLVTSGDLNKVFTVNGKRAQFSPVDTTNPPVVSTFQERNCGYTGIVPGIYTDQPVDGTSVTIMVTTQVDDRVGGTAWQAQTQAGRLLGSKPDAKLGNGAFIMEPGHVVAHKGRVIVEVNPFIDTNGVVTNSVAEKLVRTALSRIAG